MACGSPMTGRIFTPVTNDGVEILGPLFAHEVGHLLLNPTGVDYSLNPDHLMFHNYNHPDIPPGKRNGLFLSDCLGAHTTAIEGVFCFIRPGGLTLRIQSSLKHVI